jgi:hypothetical protein
LSERLGERIVEAAAHAHFRTTCDVSGEAESHDAPGRHYLPTKANQEATP